MIYYLKGFITEIKKNSVVLDVKNVGYEIFSKDVPICQVSLDKEFQFYIFEHIQEDAYTLYGFLNKSDLEVLKLLISVKGIGPKIALKILEAVSPNILISSIENEDFTIFPTVKSVGEKVKKRIINELKGKIPEELKTAFPNDKEAMPISSIYTEALEALISLGLNQFEAANSLKSVPKDISTTSDLVKWVLKNRSNIRK